MSYRFLTAAALLVSSLATSAAELPEAHCTKQRERLGNALQEARLQGDQVRQSALQDQLLQLNEQCRGLVRLQGERALEHGAARQVARREAELRDALAGGDARRIESSKRRLDQARRALQAPARDQ